LVAYTVEYKPILDLDYTNFPVSSSFLLSALSTFDDGKASVGQSARVCAACRVGGGGDGDVQRWVLPETLMLEHHVVDIK